MPIATPAAVIGWQMPAFTLKDVFGNTVSDAALDGKANLLVFFCNHCPYAKAVEDRLIALHNALAPRGLRTVLICSNDATAYPDDAPASLRARAEEKRYPFPYLVDDSQATARAFDAACTPDPFLFDAHGKLVYRGRIDDNWKEPGKVTKEELKAAIDAVLDGAPVDGTQHPALGCSIKYPGSRP